jgi:hypothetical protein
MMRFTSSSRLFWHVVEHLRLIPILAFAGLEEHGEDGNGDEGEKLFHFKNAMIASFPNHRCPDLQQGTADAAFPLQQQTISAVVRHAPISPLFLPDAFRQPGGRSPQHFVHYDG